MAIRVLYLGDSALETAGAYLAGVMHHCGISFDYRPSSFQMEDRLLSTDYDVFVLSDYPSTRFSEDQMRRLAALVENGAGLAMIGGWASFAGIAGSYQRTLIADILPVKLSDSDDRCNTWAPCVVTPVAPHPIVDGLPLQRALPCVSGFNALSAREDAITVLKVTCFDADPQSGTAAFTSVSTHPFLVVGTHGSGRVVCLATDAAPHWSGGFVDWGLPRIVAHASGSREIEVGAAYVKFFENIIRFTAREID